MNILTEDLKKICDYREQLYILFSKIFKEEVDRDFWENLRNANIEMDDFELIKNIKELINYVENAKIDKKMIEELAADYASLFLGIGNHPAHPYESVYLSREKIAMREPWCEVMNIYCQEGLAKKDSVKEPEDHIAYELEFMAHICQKVVEQVERSDNKEVTRLLKTQKDFLENHLLLWLPTFCDDVVNGSRKLEFYKLIAVILERFIFLDSQYLKRLMDDAM